jgi:hypothetical protein
MNIPFFIDGCIGYLQGVTGSRIIDTIIESGGRSVVFSAGWWQTETPDLGDTVASFAAPLVPQVNGYSLTIPGQVFIVEPPEDEDTAAACRNMRWATDLNRSIYVQRFNDVCASFDIPTEDRKPWLDALAARGDVQPEDVMAARDSLPRMVGILHLFDASGVFLDAVAVDARGQATTVYGHPLAEWLAGEWPRTSPAEPGVTAGHALDPRAFVAYYASRPVYGGGAWVSAGSSLQAGSLGALAAASVPATLTT